MAVWTAPATASNGALTAAWLNAEVRDHLVWLKAFADLITLNTADDEGDGTYLNVKRATYTDEMFKGWQTGEAFPRIWVTGAAISFGGGAAALDTTLMRESTRVLALTDAQFRSYRDDGTNPAISTRVTGDASSRWQVSGLGYMDMYEQAVAPTAPSADFGRLYCEDNGAGKTRLVVRFPTGAVQVIATQP